MKKIKILLYADTLIRKYVKRLILIICFSLINLSTYQLINCLYSENTSESDSFSVFSKTPKPVEIIDIPTAEVVEYTSFKLSFRMHGSGGIIPKMVFGVFKPINIGMSWDINNLIGTGHNEIDTQPPAIFFKARIFSGGMIIPAIAIGYDGQGYGTYNDDTDKYQYREKGIYLTLTREFFIPGLETSFGCNIYDFDDDGLFGFIGFCYGIENKILFLGEYDNISSAPENRANLGAKIFITDKVDVGVAGRNLFRGPESERIAIIKYNGKF
ncbi:MAG: hypothetical protein JW983_07275 [Elusimicrobia bacterium]|nr:hypothetical protein [Elusimicrobiota bacterium]